MEEPLISGESPYRVTLTGDKWEIFENNKSWGVTYDSCWEAFCALRIIHHACADANSTANLMGASYD